MLIKSVQSAVAEAVTRAKDALVTDTAIAASAHRQNLILAQSSLEAAEAELQAAHDLDLDGAEVERLESALAMAKIALSRAEGKYVSAEKRLAAAEAGELAKAKQAAVLKRDQVLATRLEAARRIDQLAIEIAVQVRRIDDQASILAELAQVGVVAPQTNNQWRPGQRAAELATARTGATGRIFPGDPTLAPGAADLIEQGNGALTGGLPS